MAAMAFRKISRYSFFVDNITDLLQTVETDVVLVLQDPRDEGAGGRVGRQGPQSRRQGVGHVSRLSDDVRLGVAGPQGRVEDDSWALASSEIGQRVELRIYRVDISDARITEVVRSVVARHQAGNNQEQTNLHSSELPGLLVEVLKIFLAFIAENITWSF